MQVLRGNHEQSCIKDQECEQKGWRGVGDQSFMDSFGAERLQDIPKEYFQWMRNLPLLIHSDELILVHAGLNFKQDNPFRETDDMMWIRDWHHTINPFWVHDRYIIHGHTPQTQEEIITAFGNMETTRVLDIDNGCFILNEHKVFGHLCMLDFTNRHLHFEPNRDSR